MTQAGIVICSAIIDDDLQQIASNSRGEARSQSPLEQQADPPPLPLNVYSFRPAVVHDTVYRLSLSPLWRAMAVILLVLSGGSLLVPVCVYACVCVFVNPLVTTLLLPSYLLDFPNV
jgi:hypothetical protein